MQQILHLQHKNSFLHYISFKHVYNMIISGFAVRFDVLTQFHDATMAVDHASSLDAGDLCFLNKFKYLIQYFHTFLR